MRSKKKKVDCKLVDQFVVKIKRIDDFGLSAAIYTPARDISRSVSSVSAERRQVNFERNVEEQFSARRQEVRVRMHRMSDASVFTHTSEFVRSKTHTRRKTWRRVFLLVKLVGRDARQNSEIRVHY